MTAALKTALSPVNATMDQLKGILNQWCEGLEPWQIIAWTCSGTLVVITIRDILTHEEALTNRLKKRFFRIMRRVPFVRAEIESNMIKAENLIAESIQKQQGKLEHITHLPHVGLSQEDVLYEMKKYKALEQVDWSSGWVSGCVYNGSKELTALAAKTYGMFVWNNPLHPDVFPSTRKMEAEVVRMCCNMFHGGPTSCGATTSGGTESILLACLAYRNLAYERGISRPHIIAPDSVHAAFDKAMSYFKIGLKKIRLDPQTYQVDMKAMKRAINSSTCLLVGSAPQFPQGIIDPIEEIAELGRRYNIPVHVDCCLGGFLLPFMDEAGFPVKPFDFRVPGVTSISADTHKYGFTPKGSSVIMYSDRNYRKHQYFTQPNWPGGIYASPTLAGSRSGAVIAACWATMMFVGEAGYIDATQKIISSARKLQSELLKIDGIKIYGNPEGPVIAIGSDKFDVYRLSVILTEAGWNLNILQFPSSFHICVTYTHTLDGVIERFINDTKKAVQTIAKTPNVKLEGISALYGVSQTIPDRSIVSEMADLFIDSLFSLPEHQINLSNGTKDETNGSGEPENQE